MKKVLGLDIGTNSIGWALIETNAYDNPQELAGKILKLGSRIVPMDADAMSKFESGAPESNAAGRRQARSVRRLNQRYQLRRTRLINALKILGWISNEFPTQFTHLSKHKINNYFPYSDDLKKEAASFFKITDKKTTKGEPFEIPEDWLIYFLKAKAIHNQVSLQELGRILYHYNQRRGFKSSRKDNKIESETDTIKRQEEWIDVVRIIKINEIGKGEGKYSNKTLFELACQTPDLTFTTIIARSQKPEWEGQSIEFKITRRTAKDGGQTYQLYDVDPNAWEYRKIALEKDIIHEDLYISEYYLKQIQLNPNYKIKQRVVDRKFYQDEFRAIWETQLNYYREEMGNPALLHKIADSFYKHNSQKNKEIKSKDLFHLFHNDIIYFQRGLKSQKAFLADCQYETKTYKLSDGTEKTIGKKVISKSAPCFQEFRIWQIIHNLKVYQKEAYINQKLCLNVDITASILNEEAKMRLFDLFDSTAEVSHDRILKTLGYAKDFLENGVKTYPCKLNYPEEKDFPGNETKAFFRRVFKKYNWELEGNELLNNADLFERLWHIFYSLQDEKDIRSALSNKKYYHFPPELIEQLSKLPEFKPAYAAYSQKAIKKLLSIMRLGHYWEAAFDQEIKDKIHSIINGEWNSNVSQQTRDLAQTLQLTEINHFKGLPLHIAAYIIYNRHSEPENREKYRDATDIKANQIIPNNSLRNPIVEKMVRETLKLVKDIWQHEDLGRPDYIHIELSRELKKNNQEKQELTKVNYKNKLEKDRVILLLKELKYANSTLASVNDIEKFRIWLDSGGIEGKEKFESLFKTNKAEWISNAAIEKYRLWAEQNYLSPYSGKPIPLSLLFTEKYQIDHIIPRSKFYDDSKSNKVVVEAGLNELKGNQLAIQFIENFQGQDADVLKLDEYLLLVDRIFANKAKRRNLKLYEVPENFIERQLNDTKYISRTIGKLLRPVALGTETDEGVVFTSGNITSDLKTKWGLTKLWKELLIPRFKRLEEILGEPLIFETENNNIRFAKEYKRIDHRHHALDALIVACTSRSHIKYLNSLNSFSNNKGDIIKYNEWCKWKYLLNQKKRLENQENGMLEFSMPWNNFFSDARTALESVIVSHKPTSKLISKTINKYYKYVETAPGIWEKKIQLQAAPENEDKFWVAVRQSMFGQPYGKIHIAEYKKNVPLKQAIKFQIEFLNRPAGIWCSEDWRIAKSDIRKKLDRIIRQLNFDEKAIVKYLSAQPIQAENGENVEKLDLLQFKKYASKRVSIDESFTKDKISKLPYAAAPKNWLSNLLRSHLEEFGDDPKLAFKGEALEQFYKKAPYPITKVTRMEKGEKIELKNKLLDGDKGVNQFFIVEIKNEINKKTGENELKRFYSTPSFLECIERLAKGLAVHDENPASKYIVLSPGDMVYVPREKESISSIDWNNHQSIANRIYVMKSSQNSECYFLPATVSSLIAYYDSSTKKGEFGSLNKSEKNWDQTQAIKHQFIKLKVDRLGNVMPH